MNIKKNIKIKNIKIKNRGFFCFWAAALIACMAAIFALSSKTGGQSGEMSGAIVSGLFGVNADGGAGAPESAAALEKFERLDFILRKSAHFLIFSALGFCVANLIGQTQIAENKKRVFWLSLGFGSFYAATDEWHQYFVPGRSCMWQDWAIDTAGVFAGVSAALLFARILKKLITKN